MELNREQVIKTLECCTSEAGCTGCPHFPSVYGCSRLVMQNALSLIKELTVENEAISKRYAIYVVRAIELDKQVQRLTEENERLRGVGIPDNAVYIRLSDAKTAILKYACEQTVSKYASSEICKAVRDGAEGAMNELDYLTPVSVAPIADTVRKMQEQLKMEIDRFGKKDGFITKETVNWFIDQIAKEIIGGSYGKKD